MAALNVPMLEAPQKVRRTRKTHAKVKTGCLTCKIRKKRCDELRPACLRCTSTGRKCDGYNSPSTCDLSDTSESTSTYEFDLFVSTIVENQKPTKRLKRADSIGTHHFNYQIQFSRNLSIFSFESTVEGQCFDYFRQATGPQFSSYFDSSLWRGFVIQAAFHNPAVQNAVAAVGAAHRRFGLGITPEAFQYCAIADTLYRKALKNLQGLQGSGDPQSRQFAAMSSMILSLFEAFQTNYHQSVYHLTNGLKYLLAGRLKLTHSESRHCAEPVKPMVFQHLFNRIYCRATALFGSRINILCCYGQGLSLPVIPEQFSSLEEARDFIFTEVEWIIHSPVRSWKDMDKRQERQNMHISRMLKWTGAYAETIRNMPDRTAREKKACMLLKLTRNAAYLILYVILFVYVDTSSSRMPDIDLNIDSEEGEDDGLAAITKSLAELIEKQDQLDASLTRFGIVAESILSDESIWCYEEHSMCFDSGVGPPLLPDPDPDFSSAKLKHVMRSLLLKDTSSYTDLYQTLGVYGIAERLSAIEEHAVIAALQDHLIPKNLDARWIDITCFMEQNKVLLRYCHLDDSGIGLIWTQEWLEIG